MCLAVYIASDQHLPLVAWNKNDPSLHVSELTSNRRVKKQFSLANVCYVGSRDLCGCGFIKEAEYGEGLAKIEQDFAKLAAYITALLQDGSSVELFSCWAGDQTSAVVYFEQIRAEDLTHKDFEFKEKALYRVS